MEKLCEIADNRIVVVINNFFTLFCTNYNNIHKNQDCWESELPTYYSKMEIVLVIMALE
jgi:hypothetical protein